MIAAPLVGVVELRCCRQSVPRGARQNQLVAAQLELRHWNGDVVLGDRKEAAGIDDGVGDRFVGRDDDVVDRSDALTHVIVDGMAEDLPLGAPAQGDIAQFTVAYAEESRASHLCLRDRRRAQTDARNDDELDEFHDTLHCGGGWLGLFRLFSLDAAVNGVENGEFRLLDR